MLAFSRAIFRGGGEIHSFNTIISRKNIEEAWNEFLCGKCNRKDVSEFALRLDDNLRNLHYDLKNKTYRHGGYKAFKVNDPKPRDIHKASVRDRLVHHLLYGALSPYFDTKFIHDSYSCRIGKGTHKAMDRFQEFGRSVSRNNTRTCWVLKCDIRKFFANIDHNVLKAILAKHIQDSDTLLLLGNIIDSFYTRGSTSGIEVGLPLGNLTSQLLVNIYMNEFDQYVKRKLMVKHYIRYADDFVVLFEDKTYLETLIPVISQYLETTFKLSLHPDKVYIVTLASGVDFLGWVHFPAYRVLRTSTKRRMFKKLSEVQPCSADSPVLASYIGMLGYGNAFKLRKLVVQ